MPTKQPAAFQHVNVFVLPAAEALLFHGQELSLDSEHNLKNYLFSISF